MMTRESGKKREQIQLMSLDDLAPQDHLARKSEAALDWNFIYELVEEKCSEDSGRPSIDPVVLIKLLVIQYIFGLRSMRQTIREAEVNTAYRVQTACDAKGIILGYSVHPGNENDGRTFPAVLEKLGHLPVEIVVGDTAYTEDGQHKLSCGCGGVDGLFLGDELHLLVGQLLCQIQQVAGVPGKTADGFYNHRIALTHIGEHLPQLRSIRIFAVGPVNVELVNAQTLHQNFLTDGILLLSAYPDISNFQNIMYPFPFPNFCGRLPHRR